MPRVKKGESEKDFVSRCIPIVIEEGTAKDPKQAAAVCYSMYKEAKKVKNSNKNDLHQVTMLQEGTADTAVLTGTIYRKQIVRFGKWVNPLFPIEFMVLDKKWAEGIVKNFNDDVVERVPVPLDHTDQVDRNAGEVIKLEIKDDGLYGYLDIRDQETVDRIEGGLIFDVSISFDWNYIDTETGDEHGPTLLHVALVNNPYLKGMKPFETVKELIDQFSRTLAKPYNASAIMLSESKVKELQAMETATVKNDRDFDVTVTVKDEDGEAAEKILKPGEETEVPKDQAEEVLGQIEAAEAPSGDGEGDEGGEGAGDGAGEGEGSGEGEGAGAGEGDEDDKDQQLSRLQKENATYKLSEKYNQLLEAGKITPAQKDKFMALAEVSTNTVQLSGKSVSLADVVAGILEAGPKVVKFSEDGSGKQGDEDGDDADKKPSEKLSEAELKGFQAVGSDPKKYDEIAEKHPEALAALDASPKRK